MLRCFFSISLADGVLLYSESFLSISGNSGELRCGCVHIQNTNFVSDLVGFQALGADRWLLQEARAVGFLGAASLLCCCCRDSGIFCGHYWSSNGSSVDLSHCRRHCSSVAIRVLVVRLHSALEATTRCNQ